jgi:hypothetical protein
MTLLSPPACPASLDWEPGSPASAVCSAPELDCCSDGCPWLWEGCPELELGWLGLDEGWLGLEGGWLGDVGGGVELAVGGDGIEGVEGLLALGQPFRPAITVAMTRAGAQRRRVPAD